MRLSMPNKIDFVISWVDGSDPQWLEEKNRYLPKDIDLTNDQNSDCRYRDMGLLRYWFRTVEKYAPWVNKIHFITWGHFPKWLNINHEKLNIVKHSDYIPKEYLPTFNSNVIEMNIHRIKELNEQFVLFNDDTFLNDYVSKDFFFKNNLPRGSAILDPIIPNSKFSYTMFSNTILLNKNFNFKNCIKKHFKKFFNILYAVRMKHIVRSFILYKFHDELCGFKEFHTTSSLLKSTLKEIWEKERQLLDSFSRNKFRETISVNQWLIKNWQFMKGKFEPISPNYTQKYNLTNNNNSIINALIKKKYKVICINDGDMNYNFDKAKKELLLAFKEKLPQKSSFEI